MKNRCEKIWANIKQIRFAAGQSPPFFFLIWLQATQIEETQPNRIPA
jgi:hypothetical protein